MSVTTLKPRLKPRLGSRLDRRHPLSRGLVSRWLLNEGGGAKAWNIANPNNHGTLTNMDPTTDWIASPRGPVLTFDRTNDHITFGAESISAFPFTFAVWAVASSGRTAADGNLYSIGNSTSTTHRLNLLMTSAHQYELLARAGGSFVQATSSSAYNDNLLHLVVGVCRAGNNWELYVDGKSVGTSTVSIAYPANLFRETIGAWRTTTTREYWEGPIYDVAVYSRALTVPEIELMYRYPYANIIQQQYRSRFIAAAVAGTGNPWYAYAQQ